MAAVIQVKRGSASSWTSANTVLAAGEIGFETDTKKMKVGDGSTAWTSLAYTATDGDISGVTAGTGLSGGGNSGAVTVSLDTTSQYVVPSQSTHSGKYLTTNGTDTSWGTVDLSGKTDKSTLTTTGDIYYASSANTPARLGIGSTGQVLTVSGGIPSWATPSSPAFVGVSAGGSQATQITNGTTEYAMNLNVENFDTHGFHDNTTNNTRITIPSGKGGKYLVTVKCGPENSSITVGSWRLRLRVNGAAGGYDSTSTSQFNSQSNPAGSVNFNSNVVNMLGVLNLSAGDYFELLINSTNGSGISNASAIITATYLGA